MKTKPSKTKRTSRRRTLASTRFRIGKNDTDIRDHFRKYRGNKSEWIKGAIRDKMAMGAVLESIESQLQQILDFLKDGKEKAK
jgi:hypothetical protein